VPTPSEAPAADISTFTGAPGTFTWNGFQVVTVTIGQGWQSGGTADDYFALIRGSGETATGAVTVNMFGGTTYGDPCSGPGTESKGGSQSVQTLLDYLASIKALVVSTPEPVTIDGLAGESATISTTAKGCANGRIWLWQTPVSGDFHLVNGESAEIWAVDNAGTTLVVFAEAFHSEADLNAMLPAVDDIISSMTIAH
jgi:hypothetical protein